MVPQVGLQAETPGVPINKTTTQFGSRFIKCGSAPVQERPHTYIFAFNRQNQLSVWVASEFASRLHQPAAAMLSWHNLRSNLPPRTRKSRRKPTPRGRIWKRELSACRVPPKTLNPSSKQIRLRATNKCDQSDISPNSFNRASPISLVDTALSPSPMISAVRMPLRRTFATAWSTKSASSPRLKE
jgi:hypothetical protein